MMVIEVRQSGDVRVQDYLIDGNLHRSRVYASWRALFEVWGPRWSIDSRRSVWVRRPIYDPLRTADEPV